MKRYFCTFLSIILCGAFFCSAQKTPFTFADAYPVTNIDSLDNLLKAHPQPTDERLKNLIRLYRIPYINKIPQSHYLGEISQLSEHLKQPVGKIISDFWSSSDFEDKVQALKQFESLKDTSGIIYVLTKLVRSNYDMGLLGTGDQYAAESYLIRAKQLLKARFNVHDFFAVTNAEFVYHGAKENSNHEAVLQSLTKALRLCESAPEYRYAWMLFKGNIAVTHFYRKDYAASYAINKEILAHLQSSQLIGAKIMFTQNLANDCKFLKRYDERLALCKKISTLIRPYPKSVIPNDYLNFYVAYKEEMDLRGHYREASQYGDSIVMIQDTIYNMERERKLIEFEAKNKQSQIAELTLQKRDTENRNRFIMTLLAIFVVVALALGYLGVRLRQANTRLNDLVQLRDEFIRIIAHDLRRPLHAFYGLSEVFSKLLQRGDQAAIVKLSQSIDQSGLYIRQMLDNLLYWALSQKGKLGLQSVTFVLQPQLEALVSVYSAVTLVKGVGLTYTCPPHLTIHTDLNAFNLILRNLIDNATQHTAATGTIHIEVQPATEPNEVQISISDDGKGMTEAQLHLIREVMTTPQRFQPKQHNLGLGLIIVSTFAQQAGIRMRVKSKQGQGTTFELYVKLGVSA